MSKDAMIRARTESSLKSSVEIIFKKLGLTTTEAINLFFRQVKLNNGIPFEIKIPNEITLQTFKDSDNNKNLIECKDTNDLFDKLGI